MELYDVFTLDDNRDYSLVKMEEYQGKTYCLLVEVDSEGNPLEEMLILRKIPIDQDEFEFEELDEEELDAVTEIFKDQFLDEEESE